MKSKSTYINYEDFPNNDMDRCKYNNNIYFCKANMSLRLKALNSLKFKIKIKQSIHDK